MKSFSIIVAKACNLVQIQLNCSSCSCNCMFFSPFTSVDTLFFPGPHNTNTTPPPPKLSTMMLPSHPRLVSSGCKKQSLLKMSWLLCCLEMMSLRWIHSRGITRNQNLSCESLRKDTHTHSCRQLWIVYAKTILSSFQPVE